LVPLMSVRVEGHRNIGLTVQDRGRSIVVVKYKNYIVNCHVKLICIKPDQILETWPPINRGQERLATHIEIEPVNSKLILNIL
jgi:hypothetical protein